jgi:hypothetical protein
MIVKVTCLGEQIKEGEICKVFDVDKTRKLNVNEDGIRRPSSNIAIENIPTWPMESNGQETTDEISARPCLSAVPPEPQKNMQV